MIKTETLDREGRVCLTFLCIEKGNVKRFFIRQLQLAEGMRISGGQKRVHGQFEGFEDVAGIVEGWSAYRKPQVCFQRIQPFAKVARRRKSYDDENDITSCPSITPSKVNEIPHIYVE